MPGADGLGVGQEPGAGVAARRGQGPPGWRGTGLDMTLGAGSATTAGEDEKLPHPREPGDAGARRIGLLEDIQLVHF